jgi:hypothetical protein
MEQQEREDNDQPEVVEEEERDGDINDILAEYLGTGEFAEEPEGEDLFGSDLEEDYKSDPELDTYEAEGIDEQVNNSIFHYDVTNSHFNIRLTESNRCLSHLVVKLMLNFKNRKNVNRV